MMYTNCFLFSCACGQQISTISKSLVIKTNKTLIHSTQMANHKRITVMQSKSSRPHPIQTIREIYGEPEIWRNMWRKRNRISGIK